MAFRDSLINSWNQPNFLTILLWPLSLLYRGLFAIRRQLYKLGALNRYTAPVPVIVVGNITVGGTGKSPLVIYLVEQLRNAGYKPGVVSRGYGSAAQHYPYSVTSTSSVLEAGDEPLMIVKRTQVPMVIGSDRGAAIEMLLQDQSIDIVVSDDGLQHLALQRDIELCLVDATSKQSNTCLLPAGPYREHRSRLSSVDFVIHHGGDSQEATMHLVASNPVSVLGHSSNSDPKVFDSGSHVHAVAGIGNPQRFFDSCEELGFSITPHAFPDHHKFELSDLDFSDQLPVLMTEKDAVKCRQFAQPNHWYLPVNAKLSAGFENTLIGAVKAIKKRV